MAGTLALGAACLPLLPEVDNPCQAWPEPGLYRLPVPGYERTPTIYVPATAGPRTALIALHGAGGSGEAMRDGITSLGAVARQDGHVAVFPDGSGTPAGYYWDAGGCCGVIAADDVGFLDAVADAVRERVCVDRVVATGQSNGGMMAMRWTCEGAGPDAVYASSGPLLTGQCSGVPVPVVETHGVDDAVVPFDGGRGSGGEVAFPVPREAFLEVVARNQCAAEPARVVSGAARCLVYDCAVETRFCGLTGFGHRWPGGVKGGPEGVDAEAIVRALLDQSPLPLPDASDPPDVPDEPGAQPEPTAR